MTDPACELSPKVFERVRRLVHDRAGIELHAGKEALVVARLGTLYYFFHFLLLLPVLGKIERPLPLPPSIAEAVLKQKAG